MKKPLTTTQKLNVLSTLKRDGEFFVEKHLKNGVLTTHEFTLFIVLTKIKELNESNLKALKNGLKKALESAKTKELKFYLERDLFGVDLLLGAC